MSIIVLHKRKIFSDLLQKYKYNIQFFDRPNINKCPTVELLSFDFIKNALLSLDQIPVGIISTLCMFVSYKEKKFEN